MTPLTLYRLRQVLDQDVVAGAKALLGTELVRGSRRARIVETEAYRAEGDPGSHAYRGPTPRNKAMYGRSGLAYVYFNYGCHWMLNVVAHEEGMAAAVLVRAAKPLAGLDEFRALRPKAKHDRDLLSGPGKLAAAFEITAQDYGTDLFSPHSQLRIEPGHPASAIMAGTRIGLAPGRGENIPWRFVDAHEICYISDKNGLKSL